MLRMPAQLTRLVLLTVGKVAVYLVAKYFLTPPAFGHYGFYRGEALAEVSSHPLTDAGRAASEGCPFDAHELPPGMLVGE